MAQLNELGYTDHGLTDAEINAELQAERLMTAMEEGVDHDWDINAEINTDVNIGNWLETGRPKLEGAQ